MVFHVKVQLSTVVLQDQALQSNTKPVLLSLLMASSLCERSLSVSNCEL